MALTGYKRASGKRSGGICKISMIAANQITGAEIDESGVCTALILAEEAAFQHYQFDEDQALYTETVACGKGALSVTHVLSFVLGRLDDASRKAVEELAEVSPDGVVAVVTTNNGVSLLVGYSERFGIERALKLEKSVGTTGEKLSDAGAEQVVLSCTDIAKALVYSGTEV